MISVTIVGSQVSVMLHTLKVVDNSVCCDGELVSCNEYYFLQEYTNVA